MISSLVLAWEPPFPPTRADRFRAAGLVQGLAALGPVTLATFVGRADAGELPAGVRHVAVGLRRYERLAGLAAEPAFPLGVHLYWSPAAADRLAEILSRDRFDLAVCSRLRTAYYASRVRAGLRVLDLCDSLALDRAGAAGRGVAGREARWRTALWAGVEELERRLPEEFDETWLCSAADARHLRQGLGARGRLRVVPHGCFTPARSDPDRLVAERRGHQPPRLLFLGDLACPRDREAVRLLAGRVAPRLARRGPAEVWVAGDGWPEAGLLFPKLQFLGRVAETGPLAAEVDLGLNPAGFGPGARTKPPESWRLGLPVVGTAFGFEGFPPGPALRVADDAEGLAERARELLADGAAYRAAVADALARCRTFSWEAVVGWAAERVGRPS